MRRAGPPPRAVRARGRRPAVSAGGACVEGGAGQGVGVGGAGRAELRARGMRCPPRLQADAPTHPPTHPTHPPHPPTCSNDLYGARDAGCFAWLWGQDVHNFAQVCGWGWGRVRACVRACMFLWMGERAPVGAGRPLTCPRAVHVSAHAPPTHTLIHPPTHPTPLLVPPPRWSAVSRLATTLTAWGGCE